MLQHSSLYCFCRIQLHGVEAHQFIPVDFSNLVLDLTVYSATSWENDDDLFSNNLVGESYSSMRPETWLQILEKIEDSYHLQAMLHQVSILTMA